MQAIFGLLLFLSLLGVIIGLISPKLVIGLGNKKTRGRVFLTYGSGIIIFFILFSATTPPNEQKKERLGITHTQTKEKREKQTTAPSPTIEQEKVLIPKYSILDEREYDTPFKTQVTLDILVSGEISEGGLRALLKKLYSSIKARKFKYHDSPTNIYIHAFASKEIYEAYESGVAAPWVATLQKSYGERPSIYIHMDVYQRQIAQLGAKPEERFGLPEERRKEIWKELILIERRAWKEAEKRYPLDPTQSFHVGKVFQLSERTPLMPELEPGDPIAALERMRYLPPRTTIKVLRVVIKSSSPWYFVEATSSLGYSLGSGWVNSFALMGQGQTEPKKQMKKQGELRGRLVDKNEGELAKKHGLTREQLREIGLEGIEKYWPFPD